MQLASWLKSIQVGRDRYPEKTLASLKARFEREPSLFEEVFEQLASTYQTRNGHSCSLSFTIFGNCCRRRYGPFLNANSSWRVPRRRTIRNVQRTFFQMYLNWFPSEGASVALAEAGFDLLDRRRDVAKALGNWNICEIEKWRKDQSERLQKESRERSANRAQNIAYFTPRLTDHSRRRRGKRTGCGRRRSIKGLSDETEDVPSRASA